MQRTSILISIIILSASVTPATAKDTIIISGTIGVSLEDFHYEEEDRQGDVIDAEDGALQGLSLDLQTRSGQWFIAGGYHVMNGEVDYRAYPSTDSELRSRTSESMKDVSLILGFSQDISESTRLEYSGGVGLRIWDRDIHSLPDIPGLDETYQWPYLQLGIEPAIQYSPNNRISFLLKVKKTYRATLDVEFKEELFDPVTLDLDDGVGLELEATWFHKIDQSTTLGVGPYLHHWWFDESKETTLTKNGVPVGKVYEPASISRSTGFRLFVTKNF